jgi:hypothetical protein
MDFIERWLGVSPDGGDGTMELLLVVALAAGIIVLAGSRRALRLARRRIAARGNS